MDGFANGMRKSLDVKKYEYLEIYSDTFSIFNVKKRQFLSAIFKTSLFVTASIFFRWNKNYLKLNLYFLNLRYRNIKIGDKIYSTFLRSYPKGFDFLNLHFVFKLLIKSVLYLEKLASLHIHSKTITFVSHTHYLNGIIERSFLAKKAFILRVIHFPHVFSIYAPNKKAYVDVTSEANKSIANLKPIFNEVDYKDLNPLQFLQKRVNDPLQIRYMADQHGNRFSWKALKIEKDFSFKNKKVVVLCLHSFCDAQFDYGFKDGFLSIYDWAYFLIKNLIKLNEINNDFHILIKPHPTWSEEFPRNPDNILDNQIYESIIKKMDNSKIIFLNHLLKLNQLSEIVDISNTLIISHHGTIIPEAAYLGYASISSIDSPWSSKYSFTRTYSSSSELLELVKEFILDNRNFKINKNKINSLEQYIKDYYFAFPYHSEKHPDNLMRNLEKLFGLYIHNDVNNIPPKVREDIAIISEEFINKNFDLKSIEV